MSSRTLYRQKSYDEYKKRGGSRNTFFFFHPKTGELNVRPEDIKEGFLEGTIFETPPDKPTKPWLRINHGGRSYANFQLGSMKYPATVMRPFTAYNSANPEDPIPADDPTLDRVSTMLKFPQKELFPVFEAFNREYERALNKACSENKVCYKREKGRKVLSTREAGEEPELSLPFMPLRKDKDDEDSEITAYAFFPNANPQDNVRKASSGERARHGCDYYPMLQCVNMEGDKVVHVHDFDKETGEGDHVKNYAPGSLLFNIRLRFAAYSDRPETRGAKMWMNQAVRAEGDAEEEPDLFDMVGTEDSSTHKPSAFEGTDSRDEVKEADAAPDAASDVASDAGAGVGRDSDAESNDQQETPAYPEADLLEEEEYDGFTEVSNVAVAGTVLEKEDRVTRNGSIKRTSRGRSSNKRPTKKRRSA